MYVSLAWVSHEGRTRLSGSPQCSPHHPAQSLATEPMLRESLLNGWLDGRIPFCVPWCLSRCLSSLHLPLSLPTSQVCPQQDPGTLNAPRWLQDWEEERKCVACFPGILPRRPGSARRQAPASLLPLPPAPGRRGPVALVSEVFEQQLGGHILQVRPLPYLLLLAVTWWSPPGIAPFSPASILTRRLTLGLSFPGAPSQGH